jgi:electron transport complex protein RnfE
MFGEAARNFKIVVFEDYRGFLMALLPPGAFIGLGLIVALKNAIDAKQANKPAKLKAETTGVEATA